ncbi:FxDxF family PEP-CTERM protein [Methylotenera sp.]|uniref:FxDxF family PEP-CTERM protein n=1 Tax=Methylotenera sp. TaxID=2051956 RepID=UPI002731535B|nr:FxDxF family PEP-CTERM protein [Methylotenera sp.]MDP2070721.1 FxDxF family PEP-CTERM protein [Methylotenera sp.]MDP3140479.1 FxDxF family PEP-CTERM protein [Methylotenera sp.]
MKNTIKLLTVAMSLAFSLNISSANAAIFNAGNLTVGDSITNLFDVPSLNNDGPDYFDTIYFNILSTFNVRIFAENVPEGFSFSRVDLLGPDSFNWLAEDSVMPIDFTNTLSAGNYQVNFKYGINTNQVGTYLGGVSVAAVPEPETYAMLLAGLGLIGFAARRRKTQV